MLGYLDLLLNYFNKKRLAIALSFFLFGGPVIYFVRDFLGIFKGSQGFTTLVLGLCLILMIPLSIPKKIYTPNNLAYTFNLSFLILAFTYMFIYAPNKGWFTNTSAEVKYYSFIFFTYFILLTISKDLIKDSFVYWTLIFCALGSVLLIYVVMKNPAFVLGNRASISFKDPNGSEGGDIGNPHLFAKIGMVGIACLLSFWRFNQVFISKLVMIGLSGIFFTVMALTMSMTYTLSLVMILGVYWLFNFNRNFVQSIFKWLFGWNGLFILLALLGIVTYMVLYTDISKKIESVYIILEWRFGRIFNTILTTGGADQHFSTIDYSAQGRVEGIKKVFAQFTDNFEELNIMKLIFGNGYQQLYVDSPIFQTYHDLGIAGLLLYSVGLFWILYCAISEIRKPSNAFTLFVALYTLPQLTNAFTGGMPYSYEWWAVMAFSGRFLIRYTPKKLHTITA